MNKFTEYLENLVTAMFVVLILGGTAALFLIAVYKLVGLVT